MKDFIAYRNYLADRVESKWYDEDKFLIDTLERPWLNDQPDISCIPEGVYTFEYHNTPHLPDCWVITNLKDGRSGICLHSANFVREIKGCFAAGFSFGTINGEYGIQHSDAAMSFMKQYVGRDASGKLLPFSLTICKMES